MPMYYLIEYRNNYSDTSGSLWNFKRNEIEGDVNLTIDNVSSFKYKANLIGNTENNRIKNGVKIAVPLKYLSNFSRLLEMPLINCKIEFLLGWYEESKELNIFFQFLSAFLKCPFNFEHFKKNS